MRAFILSLLLCSFTSSLHAQNWQWQNPLPQGNTLNCVIHVGTADLWAVGGAGTILHSIDDGQHWTRPSQSLTAFFSGVTFSDPSHGFIVGNDRDGAAVIYRTIDGGNRWSLVYHDTGIILYGVSSARRANAIAIGGKFDKGYGYFAVALTSADTGLSWQVRVVTGSFLPMLGAVTCLDDHNAWAVGNSGLIVSTTDGGSHWQNKTTLLIAPYLETVYFRDSANGWVAGTDATLLRTSDAGASWSQDTGIAGLVGIYDNALTSVAFTSMSTGIVTTAGAQTLRTSNGGSTWTIAPPPKISMQDFSVNSMSVYANGKAFAVGNVSTMMASSDLGATWIQRRSGTTTELFNFTFIDSLHGWVEAYAGLLRTTDGGNSWSNTQPDTSSDIFSHHQFLDARNGWATQWHGGVGTRLARSTDSGFHWSAVTLPPGTYPNTFSFADTLHGTVITTNGITHTTDGGLTWNKQEPGTQSALHNVQFVGQNDGWISADSGIMLHTTNGGDTWTDQSFDRSQLIGLMQFLDTSLGWVCTYNSIGHSNLYRTNDGGGIWQPIAIQLDTSIKAIAFADASNGWVLDGLDGLWHTTDAGATWYMQRLATSNSLFTLACTDPRNVWVGGGGGTILHASDGGGNSSVALLRSGPGDLQGLNYPNPFTTSTTIRYELPHTAFVTVRIVNLLGQEVAQLTSDVEEAGTHEIGWNASDYPNGTYLCEIAAGEYRHTIPVVLVH